MQAADHVASAPHSGRDGAGAIDGQGEQSFWARRFQLVGPAHEAKIEDKEQNCPRIIVVDSSDDFTLYGITLRNSPNFHVIVNRTNGFTAWGVKIDASGDRQEYRRHRPCLFHKCHHRLFVHPRRDDNVAIKAGKTGPATHMTIAHNHFLFGAWHVYRSETDGGSQRDPRL